MDISAGVIKGRSKSLIQSSIIYIVCSLNIFHLFNKMLTFVALLHSTLSLQCPRLSLQNICLSNAPDFSPVSVSNPLLSPSSQHFQAHKNSSPLRGPQFLQELQKHEIIRSLEDEQSVLIHYCSQLRIYSSRPVPGCLGST